MFRCSSQAWLRLLLIALLPAVFSCSSINPSQSKARYYLEKNNYSAAISALQDGQKTYQDQNRLLYWLDRGLVYHLAGQYQSSIKSFEQAKQVYDELYTKSISKIGASWVWNDYAQPYYGEDFERVLINIFQALNYIMLEDRQEALVEARDVDTVLNMINDRYEAGQENAYRKDGFARFLMGILYESFYQRPKIEDALIDYTKSLVAYENDYYSHYGIFLPQILKDNWLSVAQYLGRKEFEGNYKKWDSPKFVALEKKESSGVIYLVEYVGQVPVKVRDSIVLPVDASGRLSSFSFPRYKVPRLYSAKKTFEALADDSSGKRYSAETEKVYDIARVAIRSLEDRRTRVLAKAIAKPALKRWLLTQSEKKINEAYGQSAGYVYRYLGDLYLLYTEKADLRSWETLPSQIHLARLIVPPGEYTLRLNKQQIRTVSVRQGETKFVVYHSRD